jgi:hypothetical protein
VDAPYRVHAEQGASARRLPLWIIEDPKATCKQSKELCEESEKLRNKAKIVRAELGEVAGASGNHWFKITTKEAASHNEMIGLVTAKFSSH